MTVHSARRQASADELIFRCGLWKPARKDSVQLTLSFPYFRATIQEMCAVGTLNRDYRSEVLPFGLVWSLDKAILCGVVVGYRCYY